VLHWGACKKFFSLIWVLLLPVMPFRLTMFRYDCIIANFAKGFYWISRVGTELSFKSCNHIGLGLSYVKIFASFGFPGSFFTRYYYLLAQLNHLEISYSGIKTYSTNVVFWPGPQPGGRRPLEKFSPPLERCVEHILKLWHSINTFPPQKTLLPPWCRKLVTGLLLTKRDH